MAERMTEKSEGGFHILDKHKAAIFMYQKYYAGEAIEKLAEYETAEEEGRLKIFPCKVGDIIFCLCRIRIHQFKVLSIEIYEYGAILELLYAGDIEKYRFWRIYMQSDDFGRKLFLTSEEAEKTLKEREVN